MRLAGPLVSSALRGLALAVVLAGAAGADGRTPWEQHNGLEQTSANPLGLIRANCLPTKNGDECEYGVATIPGPEHSGWGPAPNPSRIDLYHLSRLCTQPVLYCIDHATAGNLPYLDFTYFQTFVDVPADPPLTNFTIDFVGMDDGSRVSIFNSANPSGIVVPGSYVFYDEGNPGGGSGTTDLKDLVVVGETNRVVVTQVDDCCPDNRVRSAIVTLNDQPLGIVVDSYLLATKVKYKPNAVPAKTSFATSGLYDTGEDVLDPALGGTLEVGGFSIPVPALTPSGKKLVFEGSGVSLAFTPSPDGSSRGKFKLTVVGDLAGAVTLDGPVGLRFGSGSLDARGQVRLEGGKYKLGGKVGTLMSPVLYLQKLKATLADAGTDSLKAKAAFVTGGAPDEAPDVTVSVGDAFEATIPAASLQRSKERWSGSTAAGGATVSVVLDYAKDTASVEARGVELGTIAEGPAPLDFGFAVSVEVRETKVRAVRSGKSLRY